LVSLFAGKFEPLRIQSFDSNPLQKLADSLEGYLNVSSADPIFETLVCSVSPYSLSVVRKLKQSRPDEVILLMSKRRNPGVDAQTCLGDWTRVCHPLSPQPNITLILIDEEFKLGTEHESFNIGKIAQIIRDSRTQDVVRNTR
jgi:hypothetical protein